MRLPAESENSFPADFAPGKSLIFAKSEESSDTRSAYRPKGCAAAPFFSPECEVFPHHRGDIVGDHIQPCFGVLFPDGVLPQILGGVLLIGGAVLSYQIVERVVKYYCKLEDITAPWIVKEGTFRLVFLNIFTEIYPVKIVLQA